MNEYDFAIAVYCRTNTAKNDQSKLCAWGFLTDR